MDATTDTASTDTTSSVEPRFGLLNDASELAHLVCCRDPTWDVALCGATPDHVNLAAEVVCTMCVEVARGMPGWCPGADPPVCVRDGKHCPDEHDIDLRILREVT